RAVLKITEEEFSRPPMDVMMELLLGLALCMWAGLAVPAKFLSVLPHSEENRVEPTPSFLMGILVIQAFYLLYSRQKLTLVKYLLYSRQKLIFFIFVYNLTNVNRDIVYIEKILIYNNLQKQTKCLVKNKTVNMTIQNTKKNDNILPPLSGPGRFCLLGYGGAQKMLTNLGEKIERVASLFGTCMFMLPIIDAHVI
ncbi:hypothetical protein ACJX0J_007759, partial [Zea mays]